MADEDDLRDALSRQRQQQRGSVRSSLGEGGGASLPGIPPTLGELRLRTNCAREGCDRYTTSMRGTATRPPTCDRPDCPGASG